MVGGGGGRWGGGFSMTASKENVTIEEDMDMSEMNDSKQRNITDQQVRWGSGRGRGVGGGVTV